jgi:hypothetical protein
MVFKQFNKFCWPYKRMLGWALIGLGILLLLIFVPLQIWLAVAGSIFLLVGIILSRG